MLLKSCVRCFIFFPVRIIWFWQWFLTFSLVNQNITVIRLQKQLCTHITTESEIYFMLNIWMIVAVSCFNNKSGLLSAILILCFCLFPYSSVRFLCHGIKNTVWTDLGVSLPPTQFLANIARAQEGAVKSGIWDLMLYIKIRLGLLKTRRWNSLEKIEFCR